MRFFHAVIRTLSACWSRHSVATFHFFRRFCWERRFRYFKNSTIFPNAHAYTTEMNSEKPSSLKKVSSVIVVDSYYYHIKQAWTCFNMDVCIRTLNGMALMPANWKIGPSSNGKNFCFLLLLSPPNHHLLASEALGFLAVGGWPPRWGLEFCFPVTQLRLDAIGLKGNLLLPSTADTSFKLYIDIPWLKTKGWKY